MTPEDKELVVDAEIAADGSFHIEAVPEGSYILHLRGAHDRVRGSSEGTIHEYGDPEQLLKVEGDILNLVLTVTEKSKQRVAGSQ
jgi:hypothetical protein